MRRQHHPILLTTLIAALALAGAGGCASKGAGASGDNRPALHADAAFVDGMRAEAAGDTKRAKGLYRKALDGDPYHPGALRRLATIQTEAGEYADALPYWKRHVEAAHGSSDAFNDLGYCYDLAGYADPAEAAYLRGVQADPGNGRVRTNYGLMLARHGRTNEALLQLRAAMPPADAHYNVAVVLESQGKRWRAKREFEKALELDPHHADAELRMAGIDFAE